MASRRKNDSNAKEFGPPVKESPLKLTRRDVIRRELTCAIHEHFSDGDPVVVHLLASAARDVCAPILKAKGKETFAATIETMVRPEYLSAWRANAKNPYNFFKHGGADPHAEVRYFDPAANDWLLLEVCADYREAFDFWEKEILVFRDWLMVTYPDVLTNYGRELSNTIAKGFGGLDAAGRRQRAREILDAIRKGLF